MITLKIFGPGVVLSGNVGTPSFCFKMTARVGDRSRAFGNFYLFGE